MRRDEFIVELDAKDLRVENDLLIHEVAYLRGLVNNLQEQVNAASDRHKAERSAAEAARKSLAVASKDLATAKKDIAWILERLDRSPIGWIIRRRTGFQKLAARWSDDEPATVE